MEICENNAWNDIERWKKLIDITLDGKIREVRESLERQREKALARMATAKRASPGSNSIGITKSQNNHEEEYIRMLSSSVAVTLQQFTDHMGNYRVKLENSKGLIKKYGRRYKIDKEKLFAMIIELQVLQKMGKSRSKVKEKQYKKFNTLTNRCKGNSLFMVFALSLPYSNKKDLLSLLLLNRSAYSCLKPFVFRYVLLESGCKITLRDRVKIWSQILLLVQYNTHS